MHIDKKTLKILKEYSPYSSCYRPLSEEEKAYLISQNIAVGKINITHDEACQLAMQAYQNVSKQQVLDSFLYGLAHQLSVYCSAWSAYAMMIHFSPHEFQSKNNNFQCDICLSFKQSSEDLVVTKQLSLWGFTPRDMYQIYFNLNSIAKDCDIHSIKIGEDRLVEILTIIKNLPDNISPRLLVKELKQKLSFKMTNKDISFLIDTLGVCGILQAKNKPSFLQEYFPAKIEEKKSHSSDWSYPVDFWLSQDGINIDAVNFWFSNYRNILSTVMIPMVE